MIRIPPISPTFPNTTLFRSLELDAVVRVVAAPAPAAAVEQAQLPVGVPAAVAHPAPEVGRQAREAPAGAAGKRSEEHTSELQSQSNLVCRLLLEKKNNASDE